MADADVWPAVFLGWKTKGDEIFRAFQLGQAEIASGKLHVRKGAAFLGVLEDGRVIASGHVANVSGSLYELSLTHLASSAEEAPRLEGGLMQKVKGIPKPFMKGPLTAFLIPPDAKENLFDLAWFKEVREFAQRELVRGTTTPLPKREEVQAKPIEVKETPAATQIPEDEREALLKGWIPPVLQGLLADHVRADQWELLIAYAFRALGCKVIYQGKKAGAKAVPDCTARYTSPTGQLIELIIDAKAGFWNGSVDDIRAMRDYVALGNPYSYPLFIANSLPKDIQDKLRQHIMHGKVARAICGRDLAQLIYQRLTDPDFNVEFELRRFFL